MCTDATIGMLSLLPIVREEVAEGRMMGFSSACKAEVIPLTLTLSPRTIVSVLSDRHPGERGQIAIRMITLAQH